MDECHTWRSSIEALDVSVEERAEFFRYLASKASIFKLPSAILYKKDPIYRRVLEKEAEFIRAAQGEHRGVIDSSKELTRGVALALGPAQAAWVHIYRRPEQISASYRFRAAKGKVKIFRKLYGFPPYLFFLLDFFVALSWSIWTLLTVILGCIVPRSYICINYEAFLENPAGHIEIIANTVGENVSLGEIEEMLGNEIDIQHIVGGNRMSRESSFSLKSSSVTQRKIPLSSRIICFITCAPVRMVAYYAYRSSFKSLLKTRGGN